MKTELVIADRNELKNLDYVDDLASRFFDFLFDLFFREHSKRIFKPVNIIRKPRIFWIDFV